MGQDGRISSKFLHPGPGYGGSCFPKDTQAFASLSREHGLIMNTIEAAIETNQSQKDRMVNKMRNLFHGNFKDKQIAILGLSFKPNTDDVRESASIEMISAIIADGGIVKAYDPIANESMKSIKGHIKNSYGENYFTERRYKTRSANAQEAHEAIRPTDIMRSPEKIKK